jgi:hypothetical protein
MRSDAAKIFLNAIVPGIFNIKINRAKDTQGYYLH